ncbi:helix-turn-helix domain-containing protein [Clostridium perfringens]|uniref:helix-turn-helix domain-containing protein n=1 Tax=Clostridium perfringens TaxID=1502 RepID=UPI001ABB6B8E|nr:helix-turn-helix domain-containing protein [Clostridium perfringens]EJT6154418.1 helix-turn-helix domain-containing protein [Clostridium perfringens]MBO3395864.1 helix-turn-helix domain-containing protein [Clostridium perfringens]MBO3402517.1 helix-turn-helix domain-containing protein [Clostridium perfringens]MDG6890895.1 hypothetical protein [Clostridium perfringens]MDK0686775.1 helix-turn-helix domain-containing protein [Clostridium perfringens]
MANKEVNSNKRGYTILENDVLDNPNLNMQEQSLLIALISYNHKEKGYAYPNYEQLKLRSKIKDNRTLSKNINSLIEKKFIKKETIKGRGCKYYINLPSGELHHVENSTTCKNTLPPSGELHYDLVENSTTTITNTITNKNTNIYSSNEEDSISYLEKIDREIDDLENEINNKYDKDLVTKEKEKLINKNLSTLDLLRELKKQLDKSIKRNSNQDIEEIFNYWNSKKIIKHNDLREDIKKAIKKAIKNYSIDEIKQAIDTYSEILKSEYYFTYKWNLKDFLNRNNAISTFMEDGSNKANYEEWKNKNKPKEEPKLKNNTSNFDY